MKWKKIPKGTITQPTTGTYKDWKHLLAQEGFNQCIYCAIHDSALGGIRQFHVEHFKPKVHFTDLVNVFSNLFYACPICNTFKGDDWPGFPPRTHNIHYPNPSKIDYSTLFSLDEELKIIRGNTIASRYLIEKLHLNRTQLILARREYFAGQKSLEVCSAINNIAKALDRDEGEKSREFMNRLLCLVTEILRIKTELHQHSPYTPAQTR